MTTLLNVLDEEYRVRKERKQWVKKIAENELVQLNKYVTIQE